MNIIFVFVFPTDYHSSVSCGLHPVNCAQFGSCYGPACGAVNISCSEQILNPPICPVVEEGNVFPSDLNAFGSCTIMYHPNMRLSGTIPQSIGSMTSLETLDLFNNRYMLLNFGFTFLFCFNLRFNSFFIS